MERPAPLLQAAVLLAVLLVVSACGFDNQGCSASAGRSDRQKRDIVFPGEPDFEEFDPITKFLTQEQIDRLNSLDTEEEVIHAFSNGSRSHDVEPPILAARILPQFASRIGSGAAEARSEYQFQSHGLNGRGRHSHIRERITLASPTVKKAVLAKCQPIMQPVPLKKPDDLSVMYWPYCIQIERCGGCCINDRQQSCQPTKTEKVPFRVSRFLINNMVKNGTEILHVERHLECKCGCIVKAEHCNSLQEYSPKECRCNCGNADERHKCLESPYKLWDNSDCRCRCRDLPPEGCTTGLYFDHNTCSCTSTPESRRRQQDTTYNVDKRRRRWPVRTANPLGIPST